MKRLVGDNPEILKFLKAWGIDIKKVIEVTINIPKDDIVTAKVTFLVDIDPNELQETMSKEYALIELKNE